ncbi:MAG: acyl-CoA ligase (AMP-forming), exosortase A system-associated [Pseudonocardia sp.]
MLTRLHHLLAHAATRTPDAPALTVCGGPKAHTVDYAALWAGARAFGDGLRSRGVTGGERVAVHLDKRVETVQAVFGASAAGAVVVPVNPLLRPRQVAHILDDASVRCLVTTPERLAELAGELGTCKSVELVVLVGGPAAGAPVPREVCGWADVLGRPPGPDPIDAADGAGEVRHGLPDTDIAAIFYTSGSTGRPKGVVLSHRNLLAGAESVAGYLGNTAQDRILAVLPFSFDAGFSQLTTGFHAGAHVLAVDYLLARDVVRLCATHRITGLTAVPPLWVQLADQQWPAAAAASMRYFANTGGRLPGATLARLRAHLPTAAPYLMYGLTEAFRSTYLDPAEIDRRPGSIGKAVPNAEVVVVRADGSRCAPGEPGELVHRGPLVALGYWNDPERTAARFRPAPGRPAGLPTAELAVWSGDLVTADEDGFLYFVDRRDEQIKTSGYRVSPTEVEEVAYETGLVGEAVAFGEPDERLGQRIVLVVTGPGGRPADPAALAARLRVELPLYMRPKRIEVLDRLPRSPNGKFDRARLRAEHAREDT